MIELKPCPCCGSPASKRENKSGTKICVECENPDCGLRTGWFLTYSDALAAWDKRVKTAGQRMRIFWGGEELHPEPPSTHYEGCEAVHPACKIARLESELAAAYAQVARLNDDLFFANETLEMVKMCYDIQKAIVDFIAADANKKLDALKGEK